VLADLQVEEAMIKVLYKLVGMLTGLVALVGMLTGLVAGALAGAIFKGVWKIAAHEDQTPKATDARRGWREVLVAAALQGAIFAMIRAAADRGTAEGTRKLTGVWPGEDGQEETGEGRSPHAAS
jgi:MFS family permease